MKWLKKGLIFKPDGRYTWSVSHAQAPLVDKVNDNTLRIYYGTRNIRNITVTAFIDVEADNPHNILYVHDKPALGIGGIGCFDDCGAMPSWIVNCNGLKYLYYTGWNVSNPVPYRNSIGLAVSHDNGVLFQRLYEGPVMDRTHNEAYFCGQPCVLLENGLWRMWYLSCVKWESYQNRAEPFYHIKYAESSNGIDWKRKGVVSIDFKSSDEAGIARSSVIKENGIYKMWYSYRGFIDYRINKQQSYRIGYAESDDGIKWIRKDEIVGIDVSKNGWDSEMIAYPFVYKYRDEKYMFYNGNGFGKSGFGYAVLDKP